MISNIFRRADGGDARQGATDLYVFVMLLLFPLFTGFKGYAAITVSKYLFFVICTSLWLAALAVLTLKKRRPAGRIGAAQICALCFMAVCCLSSALSPHRLSCLIGSGRYDGLVTLLLCALIFLGVSAFGRPLPCHTRAFAFSCTVCCLVALLQLLGLDPLWLFPGDLTYYDANILFSGEFLGTVGNVNMLSALLSLAIPLFFSLAVLAWDKTAGLYNISLFFCVLVLLLSKVSGGILAAALCALAAPVLLIKDLSAFRRALCSACVCLTAAALALSFTGERGPDGPLIHFRCGFAFWLCLTLGALCLVPALLLRWATRGTDARTIRRVLACASLAVFAAVLCALWFWPGTEGTVYELSRAMHGQLEDSFGSSRILIWRSVLALVPERPLLGGGPGTLALRLDLSFSRYVPETGRTLGSFVDNAHNEYIQLLADTGALGLLSYLALLLCSFARCFRRRGSQPVKSALLLSLACYCVQDFFGLGLCLVSPLFWLLLGLSQTEEIEPKPEREVQPFQPED